MNATAASGTVSPTNEENSPLYFGDWLKRRRHELDLTQEQLANRASCSVFTIRKIEFGERRPSRQLAGLLALALKIPSDNQATFIQAARGELSIERLASPARPPAHDTHPAAQSSPLTAHLPRALTPFIGREPELSALDGLLRDPQCSLLTIAGPGGIGKTRLAIEVAGRSQERFPDGVWFVPLAALNSPALLASSIANAGKFRFEEPTDPQTQLLRYLCQKKTLLVLDNAEHLLEGVGLFSEILTACPSVKLLVTSRERLNLRSEWVFEIAGLPVPSGEQVEQFEAYSSIALFLESAKRVRAGFELREEERRWVLKICQIVEGMPLGIELAAAWVGMLPCQEIAKEIERDIDFLSVSMRDLPERHRSLRATVDHSWKLLNDEEKQILSRLSVFHGSFCREAAEDICGASLSVLSSLRNKMLVYRTSEGFYSLHEFIRHYAELKLQVDLAEDERLKDRHAMYYVRCLAEWEKALQGSRQMETLDRMDMEIGNLRQAWQRTVSHLTFDRRQEDLFSLSLFRSSLLSLNLFFEMRGRHWEAIDLFSQSVETIQAARKSTSGIQEDPYADSYLGLVTVYLAIQQFLMHYVQAGDSIKEALRLLEGDTYGIARAKVVAARIYTAQGQYQKAGDLYHQSLIAFQQENNEWWCTLTLSSLAAINFNQGNFQKAVTLFQECLRRAEPGDLRLRVSSLSGLGYSRFALGDCAEAERLLQESLELSCRAGDSRGVGYIHRILGRVVLAAGKREQAQKHFQESVEIYARYGESPDLAIALIWAGKGLAALGELAAARETFRRVIEISRSLDVFQLAYWGLVNEARIRLLEGQPGKALEIMQTLKQYSVESKTIQDDVESLLAELQGKLSADQVEMISERVQGLSIDSLYT